MDPGANPLIKAVVSDFATGGRSTAREGLNEQLKGLKPTEITAKCIETLQQAGAVVDAKAAGDAAALASSAKERAKTLTSELEGMARRNPLGTIAGALLVGVIIGMISRSRS
jgi:hypothetical protein